MHLALYQEGIIFWVKMMQKSIHENDDRFLLHVSRPLIYYFSIENNQKELKNQETTSKEKKATHQTIGNPQLFLRQPKLWFGENFGIWHFQKIFNKCQHKTSIVYIDWAFNFEKHLTYELSTWLQDYSNTKNCG